MYLYFLKIFFYSFFAAYLLGLVLAFVALSIMKIGQPALLYLVPCVLLSTIIPACIRGELKVMWTGSFLVSGHFYILYIEKLCNRGSLLNAYYGFA